MTLRDISNAHKGYQSRERAELLRVRWLGSLIVNSNPFSSKKYRPEELMRIPGEEVEIDRSEEIEQIKEYRKKLANG